MSIAKVTDDNEYSKIKRFFLSEYNEACLVEQIKEILNPVLVLQFLCKKEELGISRASNLQVFYLYICFGSKNSYEMIAKRSTVLLQF